MTVVSLNSNLYTNKDALIVKYGVDEALATRGGEYNVLAGGTHMAEVVINLLTLSTAAPAAGGNECIVADNVLIPAGAFIERVEVFVDKETAGVNANLDVGLVRQDRTTELDFNGFLAAADAFNGGTDLGQRTIYQNLEGTSTTEMGALVGTVLANAGYVTASPDTADFTAGVVRVRIYWHVPVSADI